MPGHMLPEFPVLCTLGLAGDLDIPINNRQLASCCTSFGIRLDGAHSAYSDAMATAQLLASCLRLAAEEGLCTIEDLGCHESYPKTWPKVPKLGGVCDEEMRRFFVHPIQIIFPVL